MPHANQDPNRPYCPNCGRDIGTVALRWFKEFFTLRQLEQMLHYRPGSLSYKAGQDGRCVMVGGRNLVSPDCAHDWYKERMARFQRSKERGLGVISFKQYKN